MKTFEDEVRDMLRRRAGDVAPTPPPWQQLGAAHLHGATPHDAATFRARGLVAVAAVTALLLGLVALQVVRPDGTEPPAVGDFLVAEPPPFDPLTTSAIWPVGRDGTPASWFRTASDEPQRVTPAPSDDPAAVANAYLRDRFGAEEATLGGSAQHGVDTVRFTWRVEVETQNSTGSVYLRRVVLPSSLQRHAWVVVGATSDHVRVGFPRSPQGQVVLELSRRDAPFANTARVELPTGTSLVELDRPRRFSVRLDDPVTVRVQLLGGAPLTLTEFRIDPKQTLAPGTSLAPGKSTLSVLATLDLTQAAATFLETNFAVADEEIAIEPVGGGSLDVRYRSPKLGSGVVRMARPNGLSTVVAVVGDGLHMEAMSVGDDERVFALISQLPGRITVTLKDVDVPIGRASVLLPGPNMLTGVEVPMTADPKPGTAPVAHIVVDSPHGPAVAAYCLPL